MVLANDACYDTEVLTFDNPTFRSFQVSYLITMPGSTRDFRSELARFRPTRFVVIVHNKGYKTCDKVDVTTSGKDLWHANQYIATLHLQHFRMQHPSAAPYTLIMEDDVRFSERIFTEAAGIERDFLYTKRAGVYGLGNLPCISYPVDTKTLRAISMGESHANIYSEGVLGDFLNRPVRKVNFHDLDVLPLYKSYTPIIPLAGQVIPQSTANSEGWDPTGLVRWLTSMMGAGEDPFALAPVSALGIIGGLYVLLFVLALLLFLLAKRRTRTVSEGMVGSFQSSQKVRPY